MRKASLHITEDTLVKLLSEYEESIPESKIKKLAHYLLTRGSKYSLSHRMVYVSNDKLLKKSEKLKLTNTSDAGVFSQLLVVHRRAMKHRGIMQIKPGDTEWFMIKEVTHQATEFCNEFGLKVKEGYKQYIKVGLSMMKNYSLNKFKSLHSAIVNRYEAMDEMATDTTPQETEIAYLTYTKILNEKTGMLGDDYKNIPEKMVCFKRAKDDANNHKIPIKLFISAQFNLMSNQSRIPDPLQLYGDKAVARVRKYCGENNIKISSEKTVNFKAIRDASNNT